MAVLEEILLLGEEGLQPEQEEGETDNTQHSYCLMEVSSGHVLHIELVQVSVVLVKCVRPNELLATLKYILCAWSWSRLGWNST